MFGKHSQEVQIVKTEPEPLPLARLFPDEPTRINIDPVFTLYPEQHAGTGLFYGLKGFLVRLLPFLILWGVLSVAVIWHWGSHGPGTFLGFAVLTAVLFLLFRRQDYANSPGSVLREAMKAQERVIKQEHRLRERAMKRGWR